MVPTHSRINLNASHVSIRVVLEKYMMLVASTPNYDILFDDVATNKGGDLTNFYYYTCG